MSSYDLLIKNGECLVTTPQGNLVREKTNIGVKNGKILALGLAGSTSAKETIDATHLTVLPGVIDSQVHFREPGLTHKEDLYSGTLSAVCGGVTTIFEMPNTSPNTSSLFRLQEKLNLAQGKAKSNYAFFVGATSDNWKELEQIAQTPGCCGVKIFMGSSTGDLLVAEDHFLERIFKNVTRPISVHCEDEKLLVQRKSIATTGAHPRFHPVWRNVESALLATKRIVQIAEKYRRKVHVLHISSADEMEYLKNKKHAATVECLPQYLTLSAPECYERLGAYAQMNPPIREIWHQEALWKAVQSGIVDVIGSDHAPHTREEKDKAYPRSPSGLTGVQTLVPIMLNHVAQGRLSLEKLVHLVCINPAKIFRAHTKGHISLGLDADFTIVDLKAQKVISNNWIRSRVGWTAYDGLKVQGWPMMTILNGQLAMRENTIFSNAIGQAVSFN
jgi:dihydroorotase